MQSCKVTKRIVMYKGTLRGRISRTLAGVLLPYWQMAIMVVMAERLTVTGRELLNVRLKCRFEFNNIFTKNPISHSPSYFLFLLHVHLDCQQHWMDVELEGDYSVGLE